MADYKDGTNFVVMVKSKNGHGDNKNLTYNSKYNADENTLFISLVD